MKRMYAKEYAEYAGYPLVTVKNWCKMGIIPHDKIGRKYLIDVSDADQVLSERRHQPPVQPIKNVIPIKAIRQNRQTAVVGKNSDYLKQLKKLANEI